MVVPRGGGKPMMATSGRETSGSGDDGKRGRELTIAIRGRGRGVHGNSNDGEKGMGTVTMMVRGGREPSGSGNDGERRGA